MVLDVVLALNLMFQMKSIRFAIPYLMFMACLCYVMPVQAQQPPEPDRPYLDRVSVDPVTGHITITWDMPVLNDPSPLKPDKFVLEWREETSGGTTNHFFATIPNPATRSYTFDYDTMVVRSPIMPDPRKTTVPFTITAVNTTSSPNEVSSIRSLPHYNIQVNSKYDSCRAEIRLDWHRYRIWQANTQPFKPLISYYVMRIPEGGGTHEEIKALTDTFHIISRINENDKYTYYIKARRSDGLETFSYRTIRETKMPIPPTFITAVGTEYNSDGVAEVSFIIDPAAETYTYEFLGSSDYNYSFVSLGTYHITSDTVLTDKQMRGRTYYYKLEAWHVCKNKYTASSNMATALWLTLKQEGSANLLFWELYADWSGEVQYDVYRKIGDNPAEIIHTVTETTDIDSKIIKTVSREDDLSNFFIDGDVCYWIIAKPVSPNVSSQQEQAFSNQICIKPESNIWIPKAFTPGVAGIDSEFKPFFSYPPEEYLFIVYDRTGARIFEVKGDSDIGWNGRLANGKAAIEGVYTYFIRFRTAMGRVIEKKGTFSLIKP